jgi:hypothetical protein
MPGEMDPTQQIDTAIAAKRWSEARTLMQGALSAMPPDWKPIEEKEEAVKCTFWDMDEFMAYTGSHPAVTKSVFWVFPSYSRCGGNFRKLTSKRDYSRTRYCVSKAAWLLSQTIRFFGSAKVSH